MKFESTLVKGKILKRYKRFLADIRLEEDHNEHKAGDIITAHTANTGSMKTCWDVEWPALLSFHDNPKRKLKYSLEMTHNGETWIGINTGLPNKMAVEAIENGTITELQGYAHIKPEAKIGDSRLDILLHDGTVKEKENLCYVEIKNVTLLGENNIALFPDAVSTRGQKHLKELIKIKGDGMRAVMLYIVQREDVNSFSPAKDIDPEYSKLLKDAQQAGVEVLVYQCSVKSDEIKLLNSIPYNL
jgi:sugar fermentation stimulation protein A